MSGLRILNVIGTRPNLIKIAPIIAEMHRWPDIEPVIVHTGQHYDANMSAVFFDELGIPKPEYNLGIGSGTHTQQTAQVMLALEPIAERLDPDLVLVVGDVNSTLAAALVAAKREIALAHVEAGLRSFDRTMPEEVNRIVTDSLADFLFTTEPSANANLKREGVPDERVFFVGNVMIDTLLAHRMRAEALNVPERFGVAPRSYAVLTLHRPSNVDVPDVFAGILGALQPLQLQMPILFPVHPRTEKRLTEVDLGGSTCNLHNLIPIESLGYLEFLGLLAAARLVLTDSGGIQEETTVLGVPCLTLRENTERPVTITQGTNQLAGTRPSEIIAAITRALDQEPRATHKPDLWDGHTAERIVAILRRRMLGGV